MVTIHVDGDGEPTGPEGCGCEDDDDETRGTLQVYKLNHTPPMSLVPVTELVDDDEEWGSLGAYENAEGALITELDEYLTANHAPTGAYRIVCTDAHGEMCTVDHIHFPGEG